jgi:hypothetical protein
MGGIGVRCSNLQRHEGTCRSDSSNREGLTPLRICRAIVEVTARPLGYWSPSQPFGVPSPFASPSLSSRQVPCRVTMRLPGRAGIASTSLWDTAARGVGLKRYADRGMPVGRRQLLIGRTTTPGKSGQIHRPQVLAFTLTTTNHARSTTPPTWRPLSVRQVDSYPRSDH